MFKAEVKGLARDSTTRETKGSEDLGNKDSTIKDSEIKGSEIKDSKVGSREDTNHIDLKKNYEFEEENT